MLNNREFQVQLAHLFHDAKVFDEAIEVVRETLHLEESAVAIGGGCLRNYYWATRQGKSSLEAENCINDYDVIITAEHQQFSQMVIMGSRVGKDIHVLNTAYLTGKDVTIDDVFPTWTETASCIIYQDGIVDFTDECARDLQQMVLQENENRAVMEGALTFEERVKHWQDTGFFDKFPGILIGKK